jgi:hypothetical protein
MILWPRCPTEQDGAHQIAKYPQPSYAYDASIYAGDKAHKYPGLHGGEPYASLFLYLRVKFLV